MTIKVAMIPGKESVGQPNGISRVIESYYKYGPKHGIDFTDTEDWHIRLAHAGMTGGDCDIAMLHGLYFTGDYNAPRYELSINAMITDAVRSAYAITVPSNWVAEIIKRDMHITPFVVPHGIDCEEWKHSFENEGYVLYNKNRDGEDVCDSSQMDRLAEMAPNIRFLSTYSKSDPKNVEKIGLLDHKEMREIIQKAGVYLSVTKETFGIGVLEALASGVPVLGWNIGGNNDTVEHGVNGYLAEYGNYDDLLTGLFYIFKYRKVLSHNALLSASKWSWDKSLDKLKEVVDYVYAKKYSKPTVSVIIPSYNYAHTVERAIESVRNQTHKVDEIIVVDDGSSDNTKEVVSKYEDVIYVKKENGGVATARNRGFDLSTGKYICFLDPDDCIEPTFIRTCVEALEKDQSLYIAYTALKWINYEDGTSGISQWPGEYNFDDQLKRKNQVPTCNVMRREVMERTGGYRQRYAPYGAGSEDADLWTRAGSFGMKAKMVSKDGLFLYSVGSGNVNGNKNYHEMDWLSWQPYVKNGLHPFASLASPRLISHKVYQYDQPMVSVVVPVGPGHVDKMIEAIDSVEGQTYKKWELIIVNDSEETIKTDGYPFVRLFNTPKPKSGPGVARNIGAKNAHGKFLVFLDADDWLSSNALEMMLATWTLQNGIVYSDYFGIATVKPDDVSKFGDRVVEYDERKGKALMRHKAARYDCDQAQRQPVDPLYHWCIVTCLIPKIWHDEIGGYDESMRTWEDVDYHWRLARAGKCYTYLEEPLIFYRFDTGERRNLANPETNLDTAKEMLSYMKTKYEGIKKMPCYSCGGGNQPIAPTQVASMSSGGIGDNDYVLVVYNHPSKADHMVIGPSTGIRYGYRANGDEMLVHKNDISVMPNLFIEKGQLVETALVPPVSPIAETPPPTEIKTRKRRKDGSN